MSERADWIPDEVNLEVASAARVYDYLLGGGHNFAADRAVGEQVLRVQPHGRRIATSNRAFLSRAVRYLAGQGITQFLDLGSGIPTVGNVHEVAARANPNSRVVYVDHDPVAIAHSQLMLRDSTTATVLGADLTEPEWVLDSPEVHRLIDFHEPIGLLMVAICHFVPDTKRPAEIVAKYRDVLPRGSFLALSHLTADRMPDAAAGVVEVMKHSRDRMYFRSHPQVLSLFDGFDLVPPGLVAASRWHEEPGDQVCVDDQDMVYAGVGRKF